jgi:outer membrane receptor protein involved in Fe transport
VRLENNVQRLRSSRSDGAIISVNNPILSPLPFLNIAYNLNDKSLLRVAYGRTINRPEFRELAPFQFYDFGFDADIAGNPSLKVADIDNLDARYEYYPAAGQTFSFGGFYKFFANPIEQYIVQGTSNPTFDFRNAKSAISYGTELEYRRSLYEYFESSRFLQNVSLLFNASYIQSEVDLGAAAVTQARTRPLQGQSPYVVNAGLYYQDEKELNISILYNIYGRRIFSVGDDQTRTIYELPRHILDLTISKQLNKVWKVNFGVADLLNAPFILREDGDFDNKLQNSKVDKPILEFRRGQYVTIGVTATF